MKNQILKEQIINLLSWREGLYETFSYECGLAFLHAYIKDESEAIIDGLSRSKVFWNWWISEWGARDQSFVDSIAQDIKPGIARQLYQFVHDPAMLATELHPNSEVLSESYSRMIGELNDLQSA